jgi:hypothetical protein
VATEADQSQSNDADRENTRNQWLRQFTLAFGTDEGDDTTTFNGTIPQALMMFNGDLVRRATSLESGGLLSQVVANDLPPAQQIEYLFLAALARKPTKQEVQVANRLLLARAADGAPRVGRPHDTTRQRNTRFRGYRQNDKQRPTEDLPDPRQAALQDIWWAVLNSNEFILNH